MYAIINGIRMHYEVHGDARALPVLCIHGYPLSGEMWTPLAELIKNECKLIVPDLRGFGQSDVAEQVGPGIVPASSIAQHADDLFLLLEEIGEQRPCVVMGLSMGGYIAFEFYRRYTSSVLALALADTRAEGDSPEKKKERFDIAAKVLVEGNAAIADAMLPKLFAAETPQYLREKWRQIIMVIRPESLAAAQFAMASRIDSSDTLAQIYCPTLLIVGEHDSITPPADHHRMQRAIRAAELEIIANAGHMTPVEQPVMFAAALRRFVNDHAPRSELAAQRDAVA